VSERFDAVIVGAGLGGLAAAIELSSHGLRTLVLEARDQVGGKAGVVEVDGIEADTGPSLLTLPTVFDELFRVGGSSLRDELELLAPTPWFDYRWPDGARLLVHRELDDTLEEVQRTFGATPARELEAYLRHAAGIWDAAAPTFVLDEAPSVGRMLRLGWKAVPMLARIDPLRSLSSSIRAFVREPHLVTLLERYATFNGSDPRRAPATLGCIAHVDLGLGGHGIRGGVAALVRALARVATRLGAEVRTGVEAERVGVNDGRITEVRTRSGERFLTSVVVANADPALVLGGLVREAKPREAEPSMSAWTAILKARRREGRAAHTVLFPSDYAAEFRDVFDRQRIPDEPTVYLCAQERAHGRTGWAEHEAIFTMVNAPAVDDRMEGRADEKARTEAVVRARLKAARLIDDDDAFVWMRSPSELAAQFRGSRGAIYGSSSNGRTSAFLRPPNAVPEVRGLYLASGGAHPGGGMPLAATSGRLAARAALRAWG
jgi:1-hydroxycarotenoid 3,4-desaturase